MGMAAMASSGRESSGFKTFFLFAALWDLFLGAAFFVLFRPIYTALQLTLPANTAYVQMTAGFVFVQGAGYWLVYRDMARNHDMIRLGAFYKAIFAGVVFYYAAIGQTPGAVFTWFGAIDVLFIAGFLSFLSGARRAGA
jgi:hypothetical protein